MTRVLVTGTGGFVGSHVLESLLERTGWRVVAVDSFRHNGRVETLLDALPAEYRNRVDVVVHDLTVPFTVTQRRRLANVTGFVDYVVHVAARSSVDQGVAEPVDFILNNVASTLTVLELARAVHPLRFVHLSTDEVYGPETTDQRTATDHRPSSPYAASKAAQEDVCHAYARTYRVPVTVVNSANMFGERQSTLAFVPRLVQAVLRGEQVAIHYVDDQPGRRRYTYVRNVANRLVDVLTDANAPARLPLRGQVHLDNLTLARRVAELVGRPLRWIAIDGARARPGYDSGYAELPAGDWSPAVDVDAALEQTVAWYVANRDWLE